MANKKEVTHDYKELNFANGQQPLFFQKKTQMSSFLNPGQKIQLNWIDISDLQTL